jgi:hypothetical protein
VSTELSTVVIMLLVLVAGTIAYWMFGRVRRE